MMHRTLERLSHVGVWIAGAITVLMMAHITADVAIKYLFNWPIPATLEIVFDREGAAAIQTAKAKGVQIIEPDANMKAAHAKWVSGGFGGVANYARERLKIAEPEKIMATFQTQYIDKWSKLFSGVDRTNQAAVVGVLKTNLYDKINADTFGMK